MVNAVRDGHMKIIDVLIIPNHHRGDLRYATPSPAAACERRRPFFLKTKLLPMSTPETIARIIPTI